MEPPRFQILRRLARRLPGFSTDPRRWVDHESLQLALVIPVSDPLAGEVTRLQIDILRKFGRNPGLDAIPHLTLKLGFAATDIDVFGDYLTGLAAEVTPFEISIGNFGFFDEGILFLEVKPGAALENLRGRVLTDLSERFGIGAHPIEDERFRFHVTLAYGLSGREFEDLRKTYGTREFQRSFLAEHVDLFCHTGRQWVTCKRARFGGDADSRPAENPAA